MDPGSTRARITEPHSTGASLHGVLYCARVIVVLQNGHALCGLAASRVAACEARPGAGPCPEIVVAAAVVAMATASEDQEEGRGGQLRGGGGGVPAVGQSRRFARVFAGGSNEGMLARVWRVPSGVLHPHVRCVCVRARVCVCLFFLCMYVCVPSPARGACTLYSENLRQPLNP